MVGALELIEAPPAGAPAMKDDGVLEGTEEPRYDGTITADPPTGVTDLMGGGFTEQGGALELIEAPTYTGTPKAIPPTGAPAMKDSGVGTRGVKVRGGVRDLGRMGVSDCTGVDVPEA